MKNLPKNVKAGIKIETLRERMRDVKQTGPIAVEIVSYDHGRDVCGNGTAHYQAFLSGFDAVVLIVESGKRREQVGYSGMHEGALWALRQLGYMLDTSNHTSYDYQANATYPIENWVI